MVKFIYVWGNRFCEMGISMGLRGCSIGERVVWMGDVL